MRRPLPGIILLLAAAVASAQTPPAGDGLWAFRYGVSRLAERAVFADGRQQSLVDLAWLFYALKREDRWILIDPGFDDERMKAYFKVDWTDPLTLLREAGIKPEDVSLVLLTHAHFDHAGLADRFPKARIVMSEAARKDAALRMVPETKRAFFKSGVRVDTFHGRMEVVKGLVMVEIGGHAIGSSIIRLDTDKIIFTGDEAYLPENWTGPRTNGTVVAAGANRKYLDSLKPLSAAYLILTMHDPAVVAGEGKVLRLR